MLLIFLQSYFFWVDLSEDAQITGDRESKQPNISCLNFKLLWRKLISELN